MTRGPGTIDTCAGAQARQLPMRSHSQRTGQEYQPGR